MHDPMTVAFEIKYPWRDKPSQLFPQGYRRTLITIWHVDPETDGSDDSCGFSYARITQADRAWAASLAKKEFDQWFSEEYKSCNLYFAGQIEVITAAYKEARRYLGIDYWKPLSSREISVCLNMAANPIDNLRHVANVAKTDMREFERLLYLLVRIIKTDRRWWFEKPRWHVRHWEIRVEPLTQFKRWAFSRCAKCRRRFAWGESPVSNLWDGPGPRWFKSEPEVYHMDCAGCSDKSAVPTVKHI